MTFKHCVFEDSLLFSPCLNHFREQHDLKVREVQKLEKAVSEAREKYTQKRNEARELQREARETAPLEDESGNPTALKEQLEAEDGLGRYEVVEQAQAALEEVQQRIQGVHEDVNVFRNFEAKQSLAERTQQQLDELTTGKEQKRRDMMHLAEPWETALEKVLNKVDKRFSKYMKELGCVGEVHLRKGAENEDDEEPKFEDYGVEIKVSFRDGVPPSVLSAQVQSGGERAVSTIMYLMAMQVSPFAGV